MSILDDQPQWDLFDNFDNNYEHELFDSLVSEFNRISGFPIDYYILSTDKPDKVDFLYGENPNSTYEDAARTKLVYEPSEDADILNIFGMSSDDIIQFAEITKSVFNEDVSESVDPKPGDVIKTLWDNKSWEIVDAQHDSKIFHAKKMVWSLILRPYQHSEESESANDLLFDTLEDDEFLDVNSITTSQELSAYGENEEIETDSDDIFNVDGSVYGY